MKTAVLSRDFKDQLKEGKRLFSDIILQYVDESDVDVSGVTIKNSKLFFATFRNSNFKNSKFVNCEIIYGSFYGGNFENTLFENCVIDFTLFQGAQFKNVKVSKSKLNLSAFFNTAIGELDLSSSTLIRVFTNPSQITAKDIDEAKIQVGPLINSLDISIRSKIMRELEEFARDIGIKNISIPATASDKYSKTSDLAYSMQNFSNMVIDAYNTANPYKSKKSVYEKEGKYKS